MVLDGLGDLPNNQLDDKTPLESANMKNLNILAARGELGYMYTVKPGYAPGSDEAILSLFGNNWSLSSRGWIEAVGAGFDLVKGDLALRVNFASIDNLKSGNILDRRAGRVLTNYEGKILEKAINSIDFSVKFEFKHTVGHRGVLVFRGGFSDNISTNDMTYSGGKSKEIMKIGRCIPLDDEENSIYTCKVVNEFLNKVYETIDKNEINISRKKKGLMPANYLLLRGPGTEKPRLKPYKKWMVLGYMPLEKGFGILSGMNVYDFKYPKLKKIDVYGNLNKGLKKACKYSIKYLKKGLKKYDYAYIHIKETDLPGHDNKPIVKKEMLEYIDKTLFRFLVKFASRNEIKVAVTGDHSTPCKLKAHSADPVPVLLYNPKSSIPKEVKFCEKEARKGSLGRIEGRDFLKVIGFSK